MEVGGRHNLKKVFLKINDQKDQTLKWIRLKEDKDYIWLF